MQRFAILTESLAMISLRNRRILMVSLIIPIVMMILLNLVFQSAGAVEGVSVAAFTLTGVIVITIMSNGLISNATGLVSWRELGVLRRLQATPLPTWQLILTYLLNQLLITVLGIGILAVVARLFFNVQIAQSSLLLVAVLVIFGVLVFQAIGQLLSALASDTSTVNTIGQVIYLPLLFLSNLVIPTTKFPGALQGIVHWLPSYLLVDALRSPLLGNSVSAQMGTDLLGLAAYFIIFLVASSLFFSWEKKS